MSCNRDRCINRTGQVMGEFGTVRIALRGPGCINGTGRCNVAGESGRCTNVFGTGDEIDRCDEVMGTGRRRCERLIGEVLGAGGRHNHSNNDNVMGTGGRRNRGNDCCECAWCDLETPITVPR